jgi:hypothetical protein
MIRYSDEEVAQVAHYAIRGMQEVLKDPCPSDPWAVLSEDARASVIAGVRVARSGATPRELHEAWVDYRRREGWLPGPVKDYVLRTHPCLVPWDKLPEAERDKDILFQAIVLAFSPMLFPVLGRANPVTGAC